MMVLYCQQDRSTDAWILGMAIVHALLLIVYPACNETVSCDMGCTIELQQQCSLRSTTHTRARAASRKDKIRREENIKIVGLELFAYSLRL